ncbi:putative lipid phosphate phosphatase 3, chloroplastic [Glycine soja]|uniref:Putative lipid phosphate phosphatase 3, chloroplastic n=1 Tax=Glycine soja TaxID=3848 RepID=A0A445LLL1_GLYSO|nr:putative lipid phosphate phosphatase 3, chloroplastic [Glycine soja]
MDGAELGSKRVGSVKAAVNFYDDKPSSRTRELHRARRDIGRYKESKWTAESVTAQAEPELSNAKKTAEHLSSMIEESSYKAKTQMIDVESLEKRGKSQHGAIVVAKRNENYEYAQVMRELEYLKKELFKLKLDVASVMDQKSRAEKEIEASNSKMLSCLTTAEELRREIEEANEEQVLAELARIEASKELADIEAQREKEANQFSFNLEIARRKLKEAIEEIDESKELEMKLAVTISDVDFLQNELKSVKDMNKRVQGDGSVKQLEGIFRKGEESEYSIVLQTITEELEAARKELALVREEGFQFMASMDVIRNELKHVTAETDRLKKKEGKVDSTVQNLNSKILRAKSKLEAVSAAEEKVRSIVMSLSHTLEKLKTETADAKKENEDVSQEVAASKEEIQKVEFEIDMTEERLQGIMQELEVAKASEALALEKLKTLTETTMRERALTTQHSSMITISKFEYEYLTNHAASAQEIADKKVAAAEAWIEALKASEKEILMETKIAQRELKETKLEQEQEVYTKEKMLSRRVVSSSEEFDNWPRKREKSSSKNFQRAMSRKSIKLNGTITPARGAKFQKTASPAARHISPFTIKKRKKFSPATLVNKCLRPVVRADVDGLYKSRRLGISSVTGAHYSSINFPLIDTKNEEEFRTREVQLGSHTVSSHGYAVARTHKHDWLILLLLVLIVIGLYVIHPFHRFVGKDMMTDLKYPLKSNTVPVWAVPIYAGLLPIVIFVVVYIQRRDVYDLHHAVLLGRPRPDFFWRCFPDGKDVYDKWGDVICHGDKKVIKEGYKSFPSGHTSWSFAGLGFLSLYLSGKIKAFDRKGHVAKLCIVFMPLLFASLIGISRVDDYWHHWQDVFAGGLLGLTVATFCYLQFFPPPYHSEGWGPYAYFRMLEESRGMTQVPTVQNSGQELLAEAQVESQEEQGLHGCMGLTLSRDHNATFDDVESGRG